MTTAIKFPAVLFEPNPRLAQFESLASTLRDCMSAIPAPPEVLGVLEVPWACADETSIKSSATEIAACKNLSLDKTVASMRPSRAGLQQSSKIDRTCQVAPRGRSQVCQFRTV